MADKNPFNLFAAPTSGGWMTPEMQRQQALQGLSGLAQGLLAASGPSRMPVSFGQAMGQGMQGMQQGQDAYMDRMYKQMAMKGKMQEMQEGGEAPSSVREWEYYNKLPSEDQKRFREMKRTDPSLMPMPVLLPDGQPGFAQKKDVISNPTGFKPIPTADSAPFKRENTVRDEFNTLTKDFRTVQDAYSKIKKTSDSGAGDMSMLYSYVKLLDPGSVVRESEFATAAASGSYGERIQGLAKSIVSGGRLPPSMRKEFLGEAERIYAGQKSGYDRTKQTYTDIAGRYGLDPKNVITDYVDSSSGGADQSPPVNLSAGAKPAGNIAPPTPEEEAEYKRLKGMR